MKALIVSLLCMVQATHGLAQTNKKQLLRFESGGYKLSVAPNNQLIITTRGGEVAMTKAVNEPWKKLNPNAKDKNGFTIGNTLDNSNFFNADTGFVSGFINNNGKYNIVYRTTNAGQSWQAVDFGQTGWVDDAMHLPNGEAWMSVSGSGIAYTKDYGSSWKKLPNPENKQRFSAIYFNAAHQGIVGSLWNLIAHTNDNCSNWTFMPTPLDQLKYRKTNTDSRPEINQVGIWGNKFLATQEDMVFWTGRDSTDWHFIKGATKFYTDADNSALYLQLENGGFMQMDTAMQPIASYDNIGTCYDAACNKGSLYIMAYSKIIKLVAGAKQPENYWMYDGNNTVASSPKPYGFGYTEAGTWGHIDQAIYLQKGYDSAWEYRFSLPFSVDSGYLTTFGNDHLLFHSFKDTLYYYQLHTGEVKKQLASDMVKAFCNDPIEKIVFSKGSSGCFHSYEDKMVYMEDNGSFYLLEQSNDNLKETGLAENDATIYTGDVQAFIRQLPSNLQRLATIDELGFTEANYRSCKKDILAFKQSIEQKGKWSKDKPTAFSFAKNNLDFDRLLSLVDSIKTMHPTLLNHTLLNLNDIVSTTSNWQRISFYNSKGEVLTIGSSYDEPNAFGFPWTVSLNGVRYMNSYMGINQFIQKTYPIFLDKASKMDILHSLVKSMY
jgi:hypothetical protein